MTTLNPSVLNKLLLSRSLFRLAQENADALSGIRLLIACNLLQDAVESFLLAVSEHLNAGIGQKTDFDKYFEIINTKITPKELPFRAKLIGLNKLRVNAKHYGLEPSKSELDPLFTTTWEFFCEVTTSVLGIEFSSISLSDILRDGEAKRYIKEAESSLVDKRYGDVLIACRKSIFIEWEKDFDAKYYENSGEKAGLLSLLGYRVPYYARSKEYLEKNVATPTDYIVYDHAALDIELIKIGVDTVTYWNVWRMTPEVYRHNDKDDWVVKNDFQKLNGDDINKRAEYVLSATADMIWTKHQHLSRSRSIGSGKFYVEPISGAKLYKKACRNSEVVGTVPDGLTRLYCSYSIQGLDGDTYWSIWHWEDKVMLVGFLHNDELDP